MAEAEALLSRALSSDLLADALALYRNNPGLVDTEESVARRLGVSTKKLSVEVGAMKRAGLLREEHVGGFRILFFDAAADAALSVRVGERMVRRLAARRRRK
ncbi:MAG: hypothetical protein JRN11_07800 [Nitrososphaerota archaeon]|jgi:hypothetical protein|nr:hypothetical protein [Nitrososphaerota archaeon]